MRIASIVADGPRPRLPVFGLATAAALVLGAAGLLGLPGLPPVWVLTAGVLVGGAKRLYGIIDGGDLAYVEERVDADGGLVPHLSARLSRFVG